MPRLVIDVNLASRLQETLSGVGFTTKDVLRLVREKRFLEDAYSRLQSEEENYKKMMASTPHPEGFVLRGTEMQTVSILSNQEALRRLSLFDSSLSKLVNACKRISAQDTLQSFYIWGFPYGSLELGGIQKFRNFIFRQNEAVSFLLSLPVTEDMSNVVFMRHEKGVKLLRTTTWRDDPSVRLQIHPLTNGVRWQDKVYSKA